MAIDNDCVSRQTVKRWFCNLNCGRKPCDCNHYNYCEDFRKIESLPPVTPERPKGEWIFIQRGKHVDVCCDKCKSVRIKDYAYNYTVEQLLADKENILELLSQGGMHFCPNCGADMRGVSEWEYRK